MLLVTWKPNMFLGLIICYIKKLCESRPKQPISQNFDSEKVIVSFKFKFLKWKKKCIPSNFFSLTTERFYLHKLWLMCSRQTRGNLYCPPFQLGIGNHESKSKVVVPQTIFKCQLNFPQCTESKWKWNTYIHTRIHCENQNWIYRFSNLLLTGISFGSFSPSCWVSLVISLLQDIKATQHRQPLKNGEKFIPLHS